MTDIAVSERRIRPIQEAAAARNWKQALQLCDKWNKKGEKSDRFLALKASVLVHQPDKQQIEKGKTETLELCRRQSPVTDIEALYQLQESLRRLSLGSEEIPKLWDRAISAIPNDKTLLTSFLNGSIAENNWLSAQKAAMALRKAFPSERNYEFWNILFYYLAHIDQSLPEKERALFGTLAYRLISKAASAVPIDPTQVLSSGKTIATPEELALLSGIYQSTGRTQELLQILQGETLGLNSKIAENDPAMVFSLLIAALSFSGPSKDVLKVCASLISGDEPKTKIYVEDDRIWRLIVNVAKSDTSQRDFCLELVDTSLKTSPECRAAHLARLELSIKPMQDVTTNDQLLHACKEYYKRFGNKPFCFDDLAAAVHFLSAEEVDQLLQLAMAGTTTDAQRLFALKVEYSLLSETESARDNFIKFASKAMKLHQTLPKEGNERPEAALLAALALLRLVAKSKQANFAIQAGLILENAYSQSSEYYPLAVRLVQAHRTLGTLSLATERFISLSVKNMQWETLGYLLLTRISTLHPLQSGFGDDELNPLSALDAGLDMLDQMESSLNKAIQSGLEFGSYANVLDTAQLKQSVQRSLNRQIFSVEERKIQTLAGIPVAAVLDSPPAVLTDNRDFSFFNEYGTDATSLDTYLQCGPLPGKQWLDIMVFTDHVVTFLKAELASQSTLANEAFDVLCTTYDSLKAQVSDPTTELTDSEIQCFGCLKLVAEMVIQLRGTSSKVTDNIGSLLEKIQAWVAANCNPADLVITINSVKVPGWEFLHSCFIQLETLQTVAFLTCILSRRAKSAKGKNASPSKDHIAAAQKAIAEAESRIHAAAHQTKRGINESGVLGQLIDAAGARLESSSAECQNLSDVCSELYDEIVLEEHCGKLRESWDDALDGVLAVKVRFPK